MALESSYLLDESGDGPDHYAKYVELLVKVLSLSRSLSLCLPVSLGLSRYRLIPHSHPSSVRALCLSLSQLLPPAQRRQLGRSQLQHISAAHYDVSQSFPFAQIILY